MQNEADLALARHAAAGSLDRWQEFVSRYSSLILVVVRRYMHGFDTDDHRAVYVDILAQLYHGGLERYDGTVTLSSWIMVVARSRSLDAVRARFGRKRMPAWLKRLPALDREVYRLYYIEGHDLPTTASEVQGLYSASAENVAEILGRLDARMDRRLRTQLAYELQARSVRGTTARLLEFLDHLRQHHEEAEESSRPDSLAMEKETRAILGRLRWHVEQLPADQRRALDLYYWEGLPAGAVATAMGLPGHRRVRGLLRRAIVQLRRILNAEVQGAIHGPVSRAPAFRPPSGGAGERRNP